MDKALQIGGFSEEENAARVAGAWIDATHKIPNPLPKCYVGRTSQIGLAGEYVPSETGSVDIRISRLGSNKELTALHEMGHFIDHVGIGTPRQFSSEWNEPVVNGVMGAIRNSRAYLILEDMSLKSDNSLRMQEELDYLLEPQECFARAYAQWIAYKTNHPRVIGPLDAIRSRLDYIKHRQWDDDDFLDIARAFDKLFLGVK